MLKQKREEEQLDMFQHLDDFDEARIDRIAASHGDGEHYASLGADWLREYNLLEVGQ